MSNETSAAKASEEAWRRWFEVLGEKASAEIVKATTDLVTDQRLAVLASHGILPAASPVAPQQSDELAPWTSVDNWPLPDVLTKLADATDTLLTFYNYDGDGWEELKYATLAARTHITLLTAAPAPSAAIQDDAPRNNEAAIALLNEWLSHPEQEDDGSLDRLKRLIDENRLSDRQFWPELSPSNLSSLARKAAEEIAPALATYECPWCRVHPHREPCCFQCASSRDDKRLRAERVDQITAIIERCLSEGES